MSSRSRRGSTAPLSTAATAKGAATTDADSGTTAEARDATAGTAGATAAAASVEEAKGEFGGGAAASATETTRNGEIPMTTPERGAAREEAAKDDELDYGK